MLSTSSGSRNFMPPPDRSDPLHVLRQRPQTTVPMPAPSQPTPDPQSQQYPPPPRQRPHSVIPRSSPQTQQSRLLSQPAGRSSSHASMREGAGWPNVRVDSYRPSTPRSGAEVYIASSQPTRPATPKGDKILAAVEKLNDDIGALRDSNEDLRENNRHMRDQLHELKMGQKALATTEDVREEVTAQLSPALHEFFASLRDDVDKSLAPLPDLTAQISAEKIKALLLELEQKADKKRESEKASEEPLTALLNHLISLLDPINDISDSLNSLEGLPHALSDIAIFTGTMEGLMTKLYQPQPAPPTLPTIDLAPLSHLMQRVEELKRSVKIGTQSQAPNDDLSNLFQGITDIKEAMKEFKTNLRALITPRSDPEMMKLLNVANTVKLTLDDMRLKFDNPSTPPRLNIDITGIEKQLADLRAEVVVLKSSLDQRSPLARTQRPNTPISRRPPSLSGHTTAPSSWLQSRLSSQASPRAMARNTRDVFSQNLILQRDTSSDVFGLKEHVPPPNLLYPGTGQRFCDPLNAYKKTMSQADPPSSSTIASQPIPDESSTFSSTANPKTQGRNKKAKTKYPDVPLAVMTRSKQKKGGQTESSQDDPVLISDNTPSERAQACTRKLATKEGMMDAIESPNGSLEPTQTNTQTQPGTRASDSRPISRLDPLFSEQGYVDNLAMGLTSTPSISGSKKVTTYVSDKRRNVKRKAMSHGETVHNNIS